KRDRRLTPLRLGLSVVAPRATQQGQPLAALQRPCHELWERESDDNAFSKPRRKATAPACFRTALCPIMSQRTMQGEGGEAGHATVLACKMGVRGPGTRPWPRCCPAASPPGVRRLSHATARWLGGTMPPARWPGGQTPLPHTTTGLSPRAGAARSSWLTGAP